jgi:hypothetical protein
MSQYSSFLFYFTNLAEARLELEPYKRTETGACAAKLPKFDGSTSWIVFQRQLETAAEHNCWRPRRQSHTSSPSCRVLWPATQSPEKSEVQKNLEALKDRFGDQHLGATYRNRLKTRTHRDYPAKSKSGLLYDWRFTANQFILAPSPFRLTTRDFFSTESLRS